jgi:ankyrin repeat protein
MRLVYRLILTIAALVLLAACGKGPETAQNPASPSSPGANQPGETPASASQLNEDEMALLEVAASGDIAKAKSLLDRGVNVNLRGSDGRTPLTEAAFAGHAEMVKLLLSKGGDPTFKKADGSDAFALGAGHKEVADIFKSISSLIEAASTGDAKTVKAILDKGISPNAKDQGGRTALTEAAWNGKTEVVKLLLERGANPHIKKPDGASPADLARGQGHKDIEDMLNNAATAKPAPEAQASPASNANQSGPRPAPSVPAKGTK